MPRMQIVICVGSTNPVKVQAAQAVLAPLYPVAAWRWLDVASGVRAQPWGAEETRAGAVQRARAALAGSDAELGIGFEGGVEETEYGLLLTNWAAVVDRAGLLGLGCGGGVLLPDAAAAMLRDGAELGPVMDALTGGHDTRRGEGAIGILTAGLLNRQAAFEYTLKLALAPFRSPLYGVDLASSLKGNSR